MNDNNKNLIDYIGIISMASPEDPTPRVSFRYPLEDYKENPFNNQIGIFCLDNFKVYKTPQEPLLNHTVLTEATGDRIYVSSLTFYEKSIDYSSHNTNSQIKEILQWKTMFQKFKTEEESLVEIKPKKIKKDKKKKGEKIVDEKTQPITILSINSTMNFQEENKLIFQDFEFTKTSIYTKYVPKSICIISSWPLFSIFSKVLSFIYLNTHSELSTVLPLPYYVKYLTKDVLVPKIFDVKIEFRLGNEVLSFMKPALNQPTLEYEKYFSHLDFSLSHLFSCLDLDSILLVVTGLLREQKVLVKSNDTALLTVATQALLALIYPFTWPHVYIPTLPVELIGFLESPTPFFTGVNSKHLPANFVPMEDVIVCDLDRGRVTVPKDYSHHIPQKFRDELKDTIKSALYPELKLIKRLDIPRNQEEEDYDQDTKIRLAFIKLFARMLKGFEDFLFMVYSTDEPFVLFNKFKFTARNKAIAPFLDDFLRAQTFKTLIDRSALLLGTGFQVTNPFYGISKQLKEKDFRYQYQTPEANSIFSSKDRAEVFCVTEPQLNEEEKKKYNVEESQYIYSQFPDFSPSDFNIPDRDIQYPTTKDQNIEGSVAYAMDDFEGNYEKKQINLQKGMKLIVYSKDEEFAYGKSSEMTGYFPLSHIKFSQGVVLEHIPNITKTEPKELAYILKNEEERKKANDLKTPKQSVDFNSSVILVKELSLTELELEENEENNNTDIEIVEPPPSPVNEENKFVPKEDQTTDPNPTPETTPTLETPTLLESSENSSPNTEPTTVKTDNTENIPNSTEESNQQSPPQKIESTEEKVNGQNNEEVKNEIHPTLEIKPKKSPRIQIESTKSTKSTGAEEHNVYENPNKENTDQPKKFVKAHYRNHSHDSNFESPPPVPQKPKGVSQSVIKHKKELSETKFPKIQVTVGELEQDKNFRSMRSITVTKSSKSQIILGNNKKPALKTPPSNTNNTNSCSIEEENSTDESLELENDLYSDPKKRDSVMEMLNFAYNSSEVMKIKDLVNNHSVSDEELSTDSQTKDSIYYTSSDLTSERSGTLAPSDGFSEKGSPKGDQLSGSSGSLDNQSLTRSSNMFEMNEEIDLLDFELVQFYFDIIDDILNNKLNPETKSSSRRLAQAKSYFVFKKARLVFSEIMRGLLISERVSEQSFLCMGRLIMPFLDNCVMDQKNNEKSTFNDWLAVFNILKVSSGLHMINDDTPIFLQDLTFKKKTWFDFDFWFYVISEEVKEHEKKKKGTHSIKLSIFTVVSPIIFQMVSLGIDETNLGIFCKKLSQKHDFNQEEINQMENIIGKCLNQNVQNPISQQYLNKESFMNLLNDVKEKPTGSNKKKFTLFKRKKSHANMKDKVHHEKSHHHMSLNTSRYMPEEK